MDSRAQRPWARHLLTIDAMAGALVGSTMVMTSKRVARWYGLPARTLRVITLANLCYSAGATTLATRPGRSRAAVRCLAIANVAWGVVCLSLAWRHRRTATRLGTVQLISEAVFVGGLGITELTKLDHLAHAPR